MTYEELSGMLDCSVAEARERAHHEGLDRKISRDGKKRAKLNAVLMAVFIARIKTIDVAVEQAIDELKYVHGLLQEAEQPRRLTSWLRLRQTG
jgi:hypothetical protein